jgi:hypothetical protein
MVDQLASIVVPPIGSTGGCRREEIQALDEPADHAALTAMNDGHPSSSQGLGERGSVISQWVLVRGDERGRRDSGEVGQHSLSRIIPCDDGRLRTGRRQATAAPSCTPSYAQKAVPPPTVEENMGSWMPSSTDARGGNRLDG